MCIDISNLSIATSNCGRIQKEEALKFRVAKTSEVGEIEKVMHL